MKMEIEIPDLKFKPGDVIEKEYVIVRIEHVRMFGQWDYPSKESGVLGGYYIVSLHQNAALPKDSKLFRSMFRLDIPEANAEWSMCELVTGNDSLPDVRTIGDILTPEEVITFYFNSQFIINKIRIIIKSYIKFINRFPKIYIVISNKFEKINTSPISYYLLLS